MVGGWAGNQEQGRPLPRSRLHRGSEAEPRSEGGRLRQRGVAQLRQLSRVPQLAWLLSAGRCCWAHPRLTATTIGLRLSLPYRLHVRPLDRLLAELGRAGARPCWSESVVSELTGLLLRAPSPWRTTCLFRTLVRYALLAPHDPTVTFVLGMRADRDGGGGHAWLERDCRPLVGESAEQCLRTFSYPATPRPGP